MRRILIAIAAAVVLSVSSCAFMKDIHNGCDVVAEGTFKGKYRVMIECDSLASIVVKSWAKEKKDQQLERNAK
jgi:hypothetical protein